MSIVEQGKALQTNKLDTLRGLLEKGKGSLASVLPKHMTADRMVKLATVAASKDAKLLDCDPMSMLRALMDSSQVGLEPFTPLQQAYIIPYFNGKKRQMEAQFQIGYRGLIELARRSEKLISLEAHVVYEHDEFHCELGMNSVLKHTPNWDGDRGKMKLVYAVAKLKDGGCQFDVMGRNSVEEIRKKSKSGESGPWKDYFDEMAKKTVIKRLIKVLPLSIEVMKAVALDNKHEDVSDGFVIDIDTPEIEDIAIEPVKTVQQIEVEQNFRQQKEQLHKKIKESDIETNVKSDLLNKLVVVTDKKGIDDLVSIIMLHIK